MKTTDIAQRIDHTVLKPTLSHSDIEQACREALQFGFYSVCIPPAWVPYAKKILATDRSQQFPDSISPVKIVCVVDFPLGYGSTAARQAECAQALSHGADELDIVSNTTWIKSEAWDYWTKDLDALRKSCEQTPLKIILETAYLNDLEKKTAAQLAASCGFDFIKTSTGYALPQLAQNPEKLGATHADIQLIRDCIPEHTKIKASGGIRNFAEIVGFLQAGADRIGTSSGPRIITEALGQPSHVSLGQALGQDTPKETY